MNLVPPKDLGSILHPDKYQILFIEGAGIWYHSIKTLTLDAIINKNVFPCRDVFVDHFTNTLEHTLFFVKVVMNEHVFLNIVSLSTNFNP
jgi:hypothetical protein